MAPRMISSVTVLPVQWFTIAFSTAGPAIIRVQPVINGAIAVSEDAEATRKLIQQIQNTYP